MTPDEALVACGLALDIVGVVVRYRYGLPSRYPEPDYLALHCEPDQRARKRFKWLSRTGIWLLVAGFALQLVGTLC